MFLVLVMGAAVTNTGSAEGCGRSWPLCNGQFVPEFTVSTAIEYSHRAVTGVEGLLVVALTAVMLRLWRRRREVTVLAVLMLGTLLLQAGLGAGAVMAPQSPLMLATHFGVSLVAFASTFLSASVVFERTRGPLGGADSSGRDASDLGAGPALEAAGLGSGGTPHVAGAPHVGGDVTTGLPTALGAGSVSAVSAHQVDQLSVSNAGRTRLSEATPPGAPTPRAATLGAPDVATVRVPEAFRRWVIGVGLYVLLVVYLGAYVRHAGVSLACADWPLCNGQVVPTLDGPSGTVFAHRLAALGAVLLIALLVRQAHLARIGQLESWAALGLVVLQALSGALVVWTRLGLFSALAHAAIMALLFAVLAHLVRLGLASRERNGIVADRYSLSDGAARKLQPPQPETLQPHVLATTSPGIATAGRPEPGGDTGHGQRTIARRADGLG
jgi:cytochrome c oxidase assembly protein subunit 15